MDKKERSIIVLLLALVILVPSSLYVGYEYAVRAGPAIDDLTYGPGDVDAYSYIVFKDGSNYYAKNGVTRVIDYSGTNATTVIQDALDNAGNGSVYLSSALYSLTGTGAYLLHISPQTQLIGSGKANFAGIPVVNTLPVGSTYGSLLQAPANYAGHIIDISQTETKGEIVIRDLAIWGNNAEATLEAGNGPIGIYNSDILLINSVIERVSIFACKEGIELAGSEIIVRDCEAYWCYTAYQTTVSAEYIYFDHCFAYIPYYSGFYCTSSGTVHLLHCQVQSNGVTELGYYLSPFSCLTAQNCLSMGTQYGFYALPQTNYNATVNLIGCQAFTGQIVIPAWGWAGIRIYLNYNVSASVLGCMVREYKSGIWVQNTGANSSVVILASQFALKNTLALNTTGTQNGEIIAVHNPLFPDYTYP